MSGRTAKKEGARIYETLDANSKPKGERVECSDAKSIFNKAGQCEACADGWKAMLSKMECMNPCAEEDGMIAKLTKEKDAAGVAKALVDEANFILEDTKKEIMAEYQKLAAQTGALDDEKLKYETAASTAVAAATELLEAEKTANAARAEAEKVRRADKAATEAAGEAQAEAEKETAT